MTTVAELRKQVEKMQSKFDMQKNTKNATNLKNAKNELLMALNPNFQKPILEVSVQKTDEEVRAIQLEKNALIYYQSRRSNLLMNQF